MKTAILSLLTGGIAGAVVGAAILADAHEDHAPASAASRNCLRPAAWAVPGSEGPRPAQGPDIIAEMAKRDVVLLGEHHTDADHHRWQLQTLAALQAQRPQLVIGFEMFPRRAQPALDAWIAGELTEQQFLQRTEWEKFWKLAPELYMPLFQFARINRLRMVALNVDSELTEAITKKGWDGVPAERREGVSRPAAASRAYRDFLLTVYREHAAMRGKDEDKVSLTDSDFLNFVDSQQTWDRAMAEALAQYAKVPEGQTGPLVVGIMGTGHIRHGHGVPLQLRDLGVSRIGMLLPVGAHTPCDGIKKGLADAVFALPEQEQAKPPPPRLGVRLDQDGDAVRIVEVNAGSLAEASGLKSGDRLLLLAGVAPKKVGEVVDVVRRAPEGTWLPLQVKRGEETLDIVVKFPAKK
ncbi:MAG TPA: ChaN family lipoprotein [Burkholderiales bacterium]|nr:ChaN family lipoprotein [Burkholderiales bacterium]